MSTRPQYRWINLGDQLRLVIWCAVLMLLGVSVRANTVISLDPIYTNGMVFQQGAVIPVRGEAKAGTKVCVSFAEQQITTNAGQDGVWQVALDPMRASCMPRVLKVVSGDETIQISDVLVGEVWLLAGQSNMDFPLGSCIGSEALIREIAKKDSIRLLDPPKSVPSGASAWPLETCKILNAQNYFASASWSKPDSQSASLFSGVGAVFGLRLHEHLGVPVGLIDVSVGGSPAQSWLPREALLSDPALAPLEHEFPDSIIAHDFVYTRPRQHLDNWLRAGRPSPVPEHPYRAGFLYEAVMKRFGSLPIAGILWYQGESNADDATLHNNLFTKAIYSWRQNFNNKDLPVLWVQLPELNRESWPEFRAAQQALAETIPNTAMAVAIGSGHPTDVHPRNKAPVGDRLARLALNRVYGKAIENSGPVLSEFSRADASMKLVFDHVTGGLELRLPGNDELWRDQPTGFWIAGRDKVFYPAYYKEKKGNALWLSHPAVKQPAAVRYAWEANVKPTLFNGEGLPAAPFRTDDWQPIRVACVGDSITHGTGTTNLDSDSYPAQLSQLVGPLFDVRRFGVPGSSVVNGLIQQGTGWDRGYIRQRAFHRSMLFEPHIVIINLGINDVVNEDFNVDLFVADYVALINAYRNLPGEPTVIIWNKLAPLFPGQAFYKNSRLKLIHKALDKVVDRTSVKTIDMYAPLAEVGEYFPDKLHPNEQGAARIAEATRDRLRRIGIPVTRGSE